MLLLLIAIAATGLMMKYVAHTDILSLKAFILGLMYFDWQPIPSDPILLVHLGLVLLFLAAASLGSVAYVVLAKPEHLTFFLWSDFIVKVCSVLGCIAIMSLLVSHQGRLSRLLDRWSPSAYTLFLTHVFTFTFFTRAYLHFFSAPEFFRMDGSLYLVMMLLTAVAVSIALKTLWSKVRALV